MLTPGLDEIIICFSDRLAIPAWHHDGPATPQKILDKNYEIVILGLNCIMSVVYTTKLAMCSELQQKSNALMNLPAKELEQMKTL